MPRHQILTKRGEQNLRHKTALKGSQLLNRLIENALGEEEIMSANQVRSAEIILRKILPDLQATQEVQEENLSSLTRDELENRLKEASDQLPHIFQAIGLLPKAINDDDK